MSIDFRGQHVCLRDMTRIHPASSRKLPHLSLRLQKLVGAVAAASGGGPRASTTKILRNPTLADLPVRKVGVGAKRLSRLGILEFVRACSTHLPWSGALPPDHPSSLCHGNDIPDCPNLHGCELILSRVQSDSTSSQYLFGPQTTKFPNSSGTELGYLVRFHRLCLLSANAARTPIAEDLLHRRYWRRRASFVIPNKEHSQDVSARTGLLVAAGARTSDLNRTSSSTSHC